MTKQHLRALALTLVAYLGTLAAIHPFANVFYGGDDWGYAWSAKVLAEQHRLEASQFLAAAAVPQFFWGAAWVKLFGAEPWVFNLSTLVVSVGGVALLYFIGTALGLRPKHASVLALAVSVAPLYPGFAGSFMSDLHYLVLMLAAVLAYLHALDKRSIGLAALGSLLAALALLNRQIGVILPAAFFVAALAAWYLGRDKRNHALVTACAGVALPALTLLAYRRFPTAFGGVTYTQQIKLSPEKMSARLHEWSVTANHGYLSLIYASVFLLPVLLAWGNAARARELWSAKPWRAALLALLALTLGVYFWQLRAGESFLVRGEFFHTENHGAMPLAHMDGIWKCFAFVGSAAFPLVLLLTCRRLLPLAVRFRPAPDSAVEAATVERLPQLVFILLCFLGHLALVATFVSFYNNYLLPVATLGAILTAFLLDTPEHEPASRFEPWLAAFVLALTAAGTIVSLDAHTRFVEADARVASSLLASGIKPREIYGYPSWYAWNNYDDTIAAVMRSPYAPIERAGQKAHYRIIDAERKPSGRGWRRLRTESYRMLLGTREISVWKR